MMTPRALALVLLTLLAAPAVAEEASRPPNVVLLFADDAGYADFGFQPNAASDLASLTPHIDGIAEQGIRFDAAYMSGCVCSPSRAGLLTGRYPSRFGHEQNIPPGYMDGGMDLGEETIADRLAALGYATGLVGKWHLGYPPAYHPNERGFAYFHGLLQGARPYFPQQDISPHRVIQENGKPLPEEGYVTDRFGDAAVAFIEKHKEEPFFLFVSFTAPHGPLQPKAEDVEALDAIPRGRRRRFAGLVKSLDDNVGKILAALHERGLDEHTLVVFTNDNGGQTQVGADNTPLRGRKGMLLEGGIRVPMCLRWTGMLEPGRVIVDPVISLDLLPTFVAAAGGRVDPAWKLDGIDLLPLLKGDRPGLPERPLYWRTGGSQGDVAVRVGNLKLHHPQRGQEGSTASLYDLAADVGETTDVSAKLPEQVLLLQALVDAWEAELEEPRWRPQRRGPKRPGRRQRRRAP